MNVAVQNASIFVEQQGAGQPTLFLHGNPDSSLMWQGVVGNMASHFRCIAPDLPGFGRSQLPENFDFQLEDMAAFIGDLISALKISEPLNLVVHDFGGPYGLAWAVKHPSRVRRLAIMNTIFFSDYKWHFWGKVWRSRPWGELSMSTMTWFAFHTSMKASNPKLPDAHIRRTYELFTPAVRRMVLRLYRAADPQRFRGWEERLIALIRRVPSCVLWGDRDAYVSPAYAERFGAERVWHFPENGHWLPVEDPKTVAARLSEFLA
ncbi:MAG: alpha/beta fold hydrolase [Actinomycetota bacterium]